VRYLVTGGGGFIGSHLCERLVSEGNTVYCVDNFVTGKKENVSHLMREDNFTLITSDVMDFGVIPGAKVDVVFHLASPAIPDLFMGGLSVPTLMVNSIGTIRMLDFAKEAGARFVYGSSSEVYGDSLTQYNMPTPYKEGNLCCHSLMSRRRPYTGSKMFGEVATLTYARAFGLDVRIARIFNTYGPRMQLGGLVIPRFITWSLTGKDVVVYGEGDQTRCFCYVEDMVDGLIRLSQCEQCKQPINLGNPTGRTSILSLARQIINMTESTSCVRFAEFPADEQLHREPSIELAREMLGWDPQVPLEVGLQKTIDDIRRRLND